MAKGYWIVRADVTDPEGYKAYAVADMPAIGKFGGRFLVRGGKFELCEGEARSRSVVLEFPSVGHAKEWWSSPAYREAKALRQRTARTEMIVVEGVG